MFEFSEVKWLPNFPDYTFGQHGKVYAYFEGQEGVLHLRTGNKTEDQVGFNMFQSIFGARVNAVFAEVPNPAPDDPTILNYTSMYMSADGVDPRSKLKSGHPNIPREPREKAALKPNTDYYLSWEVLDKFPPGRKTQIRIVVAGTDSPDDVELFDEPGVPGEPATADVLFHPITGKLGNWTEIEIESE